MMVRVRFGPAGKPPWFKCKMHEVPILLREEGLDAFEFQAVRMGMPEKVVKIEDARLLAKNAAENDVLMSIHAPYFINFSSEKESTVKMSKLRLLSTIKVAQWMNAKMVVFHPGYYGKLSKEEALKKVIDSLKEVAEKMRELGIKDVYMGPETMGKLSQVGSLDEIIKMCQEVEFTRPTIDWAHIHAREQGLFKTVDDYLKIIDRIENELGSEYIENLHCHFTFVEYGEKGEIRHHTLEEEEFGPPFDKLAEAILEAGINCTIISESPILDRDAIKMKEILESLQEKLGKKT